MLGEEAQMLRKKAGYSSQEELGARWQKSRQQICRYERTGVQVPPLVADAYRGLVSSKTENMTP